MCERPFLKIYDENDVVYFDIVDNGIGRKAAQELKSQNFPTHKSMGLKLTEERLRLINEGRKVTLDVLNLYNGSDPAGTRVKIGVPL